jgi:hypothetical protein
VIFDGADGIDNTDIVELAAVEVPQAFEAVTVTFPEVDPKVTVALVVPCPAVIVAPAGTVHV